MFLEKSFNQTVWFHLKIVISNIRMAFHTAKQSYYMSLVSLVSYSPFLIAFPSHLHLRIYPVDSTCILNLPFTILTSTTLVQANFVSCASSSIAS